MVIQTMKRLTKKEKRAVKPVEATEVTLLIEIRGFACGEEISRAAAERGQRHANASILP